MTKGDREMGIELNRGDVLWFNMDAIAREFGISAARTFPQSVPSPQPWTCETVSVGTVKIPIEEAIGKGIVRVSRSQMVGGVGWVGAGGGGFIGRDGRSGAAWTTATGGNGGQSYIGEPATSLARGLPVSGGNDPVPCLKAVRQMGSATLLCRLPAGHGGDCIHGVDWDAVREVCEIALYHELNRDSLTTVRKLLSDDEIDRILGSEAFHESSRNWRDWMTPEAAP